MTHTAEFTCVIVDDEPTARYGLKSYINRMSNLLCVAEFQDAISLGVYLENHSPDIIFLDIQMPGMSGLELISSKPLESAIIIVSAFEQYALMGFELNVCDYLLKPVSYLRFKKSVDKAMQFIYYKRGIIQDDTIFIRADGAVRRIRINDIVCLESMENYVRIFTTFEKIVVRTTLKDFLFQLPDDKFIQTHRSYVVNIYHIKSIGANLIVMDNSCDVPVSKTFKGNLQGLIFGKHDFK